MMLVSTENPEENKRSDLSKTRTLRPFRRIHESLSDALIARGRTYKAISARLRGLSTKMLVPHTREPANMQPNGPSQKVWGTDGSKRANTTVLVTQTCIRV